MQSSALERQLLPGPAYSENKAALAPARRCQGYAGDCGRQRRSPAQLGENGVISEWEGVYKATYSCPEQRHGRERKKGIVQSLRPENRAALWRDSCPLDPEGKRQAWGPDSAEQTYSEKVPTLAFRRARGPGLDVSTLKRVSTRVAESTRCPLLCQDSQRLGALLLPGASEREPEACP